MIREDDPQFRITPFQQMASACSGALITSLFMTPLDVVKIRLQAQQKALLSNKCYLYCNGLMEHLCPCGEAGWIPRRVHFQGTMQSKELLVSRYLTESLSQRFPYFVGKDAFYKISKLEGVSALWSGLSPTLVLAVPCTVIYFVTYEQLRYNSKLFYNNMTGTMVYFLAVANIYKYYVFYRKINQLFDAYVFFFKVDQPMWIPLMAGASARTIAVTIVSPLELIRTKMQSKKLTYSEINTALKQVVKYEGYTGLFRGLGSTLLRDVPFSGIYWTTYEGTKRQFNRDDSEKNTFLFNFFCGSVAGSLAAFITLPFDVLKTHQQIELGEKEIYADSKSKHSKVSNMQDIAKNIYKNHGIRGFFTGLLPRIFKVAPACAIMISTFEYGKQFFQTYNTQKYKEKMQRHQDMVLITTTSGNEYS